MTHSATLRSSEQADVLVRLRGIRKSFGEDGGRIVVLKGIDLDVMMGEILLLVGPSGSGKTTLLSIVAGILDADDGELRILGQSIPHLSPDEKTRFRLDHLGFVFQQFNLLPTLTAVENAAVPLLIQGMEKSKAFERAAVMLTELGLKGRMHALPTKLSGGEQQRVAIARSLVSEPRLLLCDEPTASLDGETGHKVLEQLRRVGRRPDRGMIIVTHDSRVFEFGDRIVHMDDGVIHQVQQNHENMETP